MLIKPPGGWDLNEMNRGITYNLDTGETSIGPGVILGVTALVGTLLFGGNGDAARERRRREAAEERAENARLAREAAEQEAEISRLAREAAESREAYERHLREL
jgi:hypothetical protein